MGRFALSNTTAGRAAQVAHDSLLPDWYWEADSDEESTPRDAWMDLAPVCPDCDRDVHACACCEVAS